MRQIVTSVLIAIGSYVLLYALEFLGNLLIVAPVAIDKERQTEFVKHLEKQTKAATAEIAQREEYIGKLRSQVDTLSKRPYDAAHEAMTREKLAPLADQMRDVLRFLGERPSCKFGSR